MATAKLLTTDAPADPEVTVEITARLSQFAAVRDALEAAYAETSGGRMQKETDRDAVAAVGVALSGAFDESAFGPLPEEPRFGAEGTTPRYYPEGPSARSRRTRRGS